MNAWTPDRLVALRQRAADLRRMLPESEPAELAAEYVLLDAEREHVRATSSAHAAGLYQGQQSGYDPEADPGL